VAPAGRPMLSRSGQLPSALPFLSSCNQAVTTFRRPQHPETICTKSWLSKRYALSRSVAFCFIHTCAPRRCPPGKSFFLRFDWVVGRGHPLTLPAARRDSMLAGLLYSAGSCQAYSAAAISACSGQSLAGTRFSSGSALWLDKPPRCISKPGEARGRMSVNANAAVFPADAPAAGPERSNYGDGKATSLGRDRNGEPDYACADNENFRIS
jgi:hypothetical protein